ncbi:PREDICTED: uncharacterized protein LOC108533427 isoform X2 [Rhinopithecus bieti]|uniref:uncharacterized protein LOC108533427 isoform X2 n=1 Tax=Rhinopithecus bieti TaxID=61621 RepID=UPI00083BB15C|nr:PREDICTED: uncharacterized protein LOC108533427 isoform X2 [Rhinopithecus bieti]
MRAWLWPAVRTDQRGISFSSAQLPGIERWGPATVLASGTSRQETGTRNTGASGTFLGVKAGTPGGPRALPRLLLAQCVCGQPERTYYFISNQILHVIYSSHKLLKKVPCKFSAEYAFNNSLKQ